MTQIYGFLEKAFCATAWPMKRPEAYGAFHLTFFIVGLAVCIALAWALRKIGEKGNRRLLLTVGLFLAATEIYKQLFYYFYIGNGSYQWWIFPFQLCSVPMYLCIIAPLIKQGRVSRAMYNFMMYFNLFGGFVAFIEPSGLTHEYWTLTLHAFVWHMMLVFVGLYLAFSGRAGTTLKDYKGAVLTFLVLCAVAFSINVALRGVSDGSVNMFYVGPSNSPIIVFKTISEKFGWYVSTLLYIPALCLGAFIVYLPFAIIRRSRKSAAVQAAK